MKSIYKQPFIRALSTVLALFGILTNSASAAVYYWNGGDGTWDRTSLEWSTASTGGGTLVAWNPLNAADFSAGATGVAQGTVNITVNTLITNQGIFNGGLSPGSGTLRV